MKNQGLLQIKTGECIREKRAEEGTTNKYVDKLISTAPVNKGLRMTLKVPFPRKRLTELLDKAGNRQLAETMLELSTYDFVRFHRSLYNYPVLCQKKVLQDCYKKVLTLSPQEMSRFGESTLQMRTITDGTQIQMLSIEGEKTNEKAVSWSVTGFVKTMVN